MPNSIEYDVIQILHARIVELIAQRDACLAAVRAYMDRDHSLPELAEAAIALCEQEQPVAPTERTR